MPNNMVSAPSGSNTFKTPATGTGPATGTASAGNAVKGFGSAKPDASTINGTSSTVTAAGGRLIKTDKASGMAVTGFSGNGLIPGMV